MIRLIQHHDQFFKRLLDQPGAAGALLRERLPPEIVALLDDSPPELIPGSFVPVELREYRTDRLYRVRTRCGRPLLIHVVIEHKSTPEPLVTLQLLGYTTQILEEWVRNPPAGVSVRDRLPAVVSLVVYHGKAPWRVPLTLAGIVDADAKLHPWLVDFRYTLVDLGRIDTPRLAQHPVLRVGLLILKHGTREGDLRDTLLTLGRAALALGFDELVALIHYMLREPNDVEAATLREVLAELIPGEETRVMSIAAEQWMAEGRQEGFHQGLLQGKLEGETAGWQKGLLEGNLEGEASLLLRILRRRFGALADAYEDRVRSASGELLEM